MTEPTDAEAISTSLVDPAAFGTIFDRYATTLHRYFTRRVGPDEADALMSDAFAIAFERRSTYDVTRPLARPWLYGIATNLVARHRRAEARRLRATVRLWARRETGDDVAQRTADAVSASALLPDVVEMIEQLPDGERDALLLHVWEDLTYDEIADALAIPIGTVRSRLNRARGRLRELVALGDEQLTHADVFTRGRERLMSTITGTETTERPPTGFRMYPRLAYRDELAALEYLTRVFGFTERREARMGKGTPDDHMLAWLEFGDGLVMIGHAEDEVHHILSPMDRGGASVMINVDLVDIDSHYEHAVAEGATITMPINDAFYGCRRYEATDLEGHRWHFDETFESIRARGGRPPDVD